MADRTKLTKLERDAVEDYFYYDVPALDLADELINRLSQGELEYLATKLTTGEK